MTTEFKRRPLSEILRKAPKSTFTVQHRNELSRIEFNPNSKLKDASSKDVPRRQHLQDMSTSSVRPIRETVIPLFAPQLGKKNSYNNNQNSLFSFDYDVNAFIWPVYKPPHVAMDSFSSKNNFSVESFIERNLDLASKGFSQQQRRRNSNDDDDDDYYLKYDPFRAAARLEVQRLTNNPSLISKQASASSAVDGASSSSSSSGAMSTMLQQQQYQTKFLQLVSSACELPHLLALSWCSSKHSNAWRYSLKSVSLPRDVSGVVPVLFSCSPSSASSSSSSSSSSSVDLEHEQEMLDQVAQRMVSRATFELVVESHVPKKFPSGFRNLVFSSDENEVGGGKQEDKEEEEIEITHAQVVRHGYYLQEPVSVIRYELSGNNGCASKITPNRVLDSLFSSSSSSSSSSVRVLGDPISSLTKKFDIPSPMVVLRGVTLADERSGGRNSSNKKKKKMPMMMQQKRLVALPSSPYASEEMISNSPDSNLMLLRKANLMDGVWTP